MTFANFAAVHILWLLAALVPFYIWAHKKRKRDMEKFVQRELVDELTPSLDKKRRKIKTALVLFSIFLIILSLMRPQWGGDLKEIKRRGCDILIAVDTSKSMLAEDLKPNRLERSKLAVRDLIKKLRGDRIGLIAFSGSAFLQCPLTLDFSAFKSSLSDLNVNILPKGGTSLSEAIRVALDSYGNSPNSCKVLVIISDGEDHEGNAVKWAEKAKRQGVTIFTIGTGTKEGGLIPITNEFSHSILLKDRSGNVVKTRLTEDVLRQIAVTTGGSYETTSDTEFGLDPIYDKISKMENAYIENSKVARNNDKFQVPLFIAFLFLCLEAFMGERGKKIEKRKLRP